MLKFSIIIPAYNSESYIDRAIQSILNQSYKHLELIIVNDGSTDNTLSIINRYATDDSRIKVISKENGGYVSAVNVGLDNVSGDYFLFMGSDDYLDKGLLLTIVDNVNDVEPDIIIFNNVQVRGDIFSKDILCNFEEKHYVSDKHFFEKISNNNNGVGLLCNRDTSKAFRLSLLKELRYFGKTGMGADDAFSMRYARRSTNFLFIPFDGYYWVIRPDSISGKKLSDEVYIDRVVVCEDYFKSLNHNFSLNYFEVEFLKNGLLSGMILIHSNPFAFRKVMMVRKFYRHCCYWIKLYKVDKIKYRATLVVPVLYCLLSKIMHVFIKEK